MTSVPNYMPPLTVEYAHMTYSRETDGLYFLYFPFVHRYLNIDHGNKNYTKKKQCLCIIYMQSIVVPCFNLPCAESRL